MDFLIKFPSLIFLIFTGPTTPEPVQKDEQKKEVQIEQDKPSEAKNELNTYYFIQG